MNGFLFTKDGKLICELTEISFEPYKDKRIIKVRCTVCGRIKRIQKWKFDFAEGSSKYICSLTASQTLSHGMFGRWMG